MSTRRSPVTGFGLIALACASLVVALFVGLAWLPLMAGAAEPPVSLALVPLDQQQAGYFALTLHPGGTQRLSVQLVDGGVDPIDARLYSADAYTLVNGGFGVQPGEAKRHGVTNWLDFPAGVRRLAPGATTQPFTVTVPSDTKPGDYIAGLVLENATPVSEPGTGTLAQTIRTAIAVSIRVPGAMHPAVAIGAVTRAVVGGNPMLDVGVSNTGNARVVPLAVITINDRSGATVWSHSVQLGSVYAGTSTELETAMPAKLAPGSYTAAVALADRSHDLRRTVATSSFTIPGSVNPFAQGGRSLAFDLTELALMLMILGGVMAIVAMERAKRAEERSS